MFWGKITFWFRQVEKIFRAKFYFWAHKYITLFRAKSCFSGTEIVNFFGKNNSQVNKLRTYFGHNKRQQLLF